MEILSLVLFLALSIGTVWLPVFLTRRMTPLHVGSFAVTLALAVGLQAALFPLILLSAYGSVDWPSVLDMLVREDLPAGVILGVLVWSGAGLRRITSVGRSAVVAAVLVLLLAAALVVLPLVGGLGYFSIPPIVFAAFLALVWGRLLIRRSRSAPAALEGAATAQLILVCALALGINLLFLVIYAFDSGEITIM
jgi:hypothetical protein